MSRVAKKPIDIPSGVEITLTAQTLTVKGSKGVLKFDVPKSVSVNQADKVLTFAPRDEKGSTDAMAGTARAVVNNMVTGVTKGFEKKLELVGVGFRAQVQGNRIRRPKEARNAGCGPSSRRSSRPPGKQARGASRGSARPVQHSHQRAVADLLRVARR